METTQIFFVAGFFLFAGILASKISTILRAPTLLVFLAVGMLAGTDGFLKIEFDDFALSNFVGSLALAFILFSGGYDAQWSSAKRVLFRGTALASLGVLATAAFLGFFIHWALKVPLEYALLGGAVVSSTDAAAVFAIFRSRGFGLKGNLRPMLEFESGANDPMAAFLTLFMIEKILSGDTSALGYLTILPMFLLRMAVGVAAGLLIAKGAATLFKRLRLEYEGLYYVFGIATVFLLYSLAEFAGGNGFMAAYVGGMALGNRRFPYRHGLARFNDGIAWLMQATVFLMLGLLVTPRELVGRIPDGLAVAAALLFVARPLAVELCLLGGSWTWKERLAISWGGFRGAAPIVLATFPAISGVEGARSLFNLVFFVVLVSIFVQGKTFPALARALGLASDERFRVRAPLEFEETEGGREKMYEFPVSEDLAVVGKSLAQLSLPGGALVLLIRRDNRFVVPRGETVVEAGDDLLLFYDPIAVPEIEALLAKTSAEEAADAAKAAAVAQELAEANGETTDEGKSEPTAT
ncbi:MAG: potassium/proton antiporter [Thermoguttaceae bacterium]|nr:potassium/proton antiporter [Thermoguttaceae bacterium]